MEGNRVISSKKKSQVAIFYWSLEFFRLFIPMRKQCFRVFKAWMRLWALMFYSCSLRKRCIFIEMKVCMYIYREHWFLVSYNEQTSSSKNMIAEVSYWNSLATLRFGSAFNLLTIWMIFRHTPREMRVYSLLLLQTCLSDLALLVISYIVRPVFVMLMVSTKLKIIKK
jgi:hypothetical protein